MRKNVLIIGGSLNQTMMMHKIAKHLQDYNCVFTPFYVDGALELASRANLLGFSIAGGRHRQLTETYLAQQKLPVDFGGKSMDYDFVITCTDLIIQNNIKKKKIILVQEGITEPEDWKYNLVKTFHLPRVLANTAATGLSNAYALFCVASAGYRDYFAQKGVNPEKMVITGIPNFDHAEDYYNNDFPYNNFVLAATSSIRETFGWDNRPAFIRRVREIAAGRQIIFKLHPNENIERARKEINRFAPEALIFTDGNVHQMIANCDVLVTQYSSVVFSGISLEKEVYSYFDVAMLRKLAPIQNGGTSALSIASACRQLFNTLPVSSLNRQSAYQRSPASSS